jgi:hypothetical protein
MLDSYTLKFENLSLTFSEIYNKELPLPTAGGDEGEGGPNAD